MAGQTRAQASSVPARTVHQNAVMRRVLNPLVVSLHAKPVLFVRGRTSGKRRAVPMDPPFEWHGRRYLVSPMGATQWVRNLRASGEAEMRIGRRLERFKVVELHGTQRDEIVRTYAAAITCGCTRYMRRLPDPADHPVFRIEPPADQSA